MKTKRCKSCRRRKPLIRFHRRGSGRLRAACKVCFRKIEAQRRKTAKFKATRKAYQLKNRERIYRQRRDNYANNPLTRKKTQKYSNAYYLKHRVAINVRNRRHRDKLKADAIAAYGGKCSCCGECEIKFLTIEHINRDGKMHRAAVSNVNRDLRNRGYPKKGYTVLCFNCNIARSLFGCCPHQDTRAKRELVLVNVTGA